MSAYQLSITPLKPNDIPSEESILSAARELLDLTSTWKQGKAYHKNTVKTSSRPKGPGDGAPWHCRTSEHTSEDATFDEFWSKLGKDKAVNEKEYVPNIRRATPVKIISPTQSIWTLYYTFPPPVSPRVFTVLQVTHLDESIPRTGIIVSIPVDLSGESELAKLEDKGVKGRYVSIERLQEIEGGKVQWVMATSSTPGGSIPTFVAENSMAGQISADVPHFLKWFHSVREKPASTTTPGSKEDQSLAPTTSEVAHVATVNDALSAAEPAVGGGIAPPT